MIGKLLSERDIDMAEAGEARSVASTMSGKTICVSLMAGSEQREHNNCGRQLRSETLESVCALGDWGS